MLTSKEELAQFLHELRTNYVPSVSIDLVIFGFHEGQLKVLLLRVLSSDAWWLPGGRIKNRENLDEAAYRSLRERTGLTEVFLQQFHTFGDLERNTYYAIGETLVKLGASLEDVGGLPGRDVSVGYYALVEYTKVDPRPDLFSEESRWWNVDEVPRLLFDHNAMIALALKTLRRQLSYQPIGYNLLPEKFTMPQLQQLYETILGRPLDRRNFQKRMLAYDILERLEERKPIGPHKAPYLYQFNLTNYRKALAEEQLFID
jgi:ADP-ribose pyrophosphatase YjhB (NUDIX family)